jgi:hypothetical protein
MKVIRLRRASEHHVSFDFLAIKDISKLNFSSSEDQIVLEVKHAKRGVIKYSTHQGSIDNVQNLMSRWEQFQTNEAIFFDLAWFEPKEIKDYNLEHGVN